MANRGDVTGIQMDNLENEITPEEEDNCDQTMADSYGLGDWQSSSLSKRWTKQPTTLNALRAGDRLIEE